MEIQEPSEHILFVNLPNKEPKIVEELKNLNETIPERNNHDVIINFSRVDVFISSSLSNLMILQNLLRENGRRLVLCNVAFTTRCIFTVSGLTEQFTFADDKFAALEELNGARRADVLE